MSTEVIVSNSFARSSSPLQRDILRVLLYFNVFDHPLKAEEIYSFLSSNSTSPSAIRFAGRSSPLAGLVAYHDPYFFMKTSTIACIRERERKERLAKGRWRTARIAAWLIRQFPFVRGVFVSGELSKGLAAPAGDIDFLIITSKNRLWICRTLLIIFKKLVLLNSRKFFCLNHFVSECNLGFQSQNVYSAVEIATLKPLVNWDLFKEYINANGWIYRFLPNWSIEEAAMPKHFYRASGLQHFLESLLPSRLADRLDDFLLGLWRRIWARRYPALSPDQRERMFTCRKHMSTAYSHDSRTKILAGYAQRLNLYGLIPDAPLSTA